MLTVSEEKVDQDAIFQALETLISKRSQAARLRDTVNEQFSQVSICEKEEQKASQLVGQLEGRVKSYHKQLLIGTTKPGDISSLKQQLIDAKESLSRRQQELQERSEAFCLSQEAKTQLLTEIGELDRQLRKDLPQLYMQKFHEHDAGLLGRRGQISWKEEEHSPERYARKWRERVFNFLLLTGLSSDLADGHLLHAFFAFFRQTSFSVRVTIGFVPTSTKSKEPLSVGAVVAIPKQMSEQEAFEEINRQRMVFIPEHELVTT